MVLSYIFNNWFYFKKGSKMETLKEKALNAISKLSENAKIDDIMYRLYVIDKVKKGQDAIKNGKSISVEALKNEIKSW